MKKILVAVLSLVSVSSFAFHPEDSDLLKNIGVGTKIRIIQDINFKPNHHYIEIGDSNCNIHVKNVKKFDRVLKAGKELVVVDTNGDERLSNGAYKQVLDVDNLHIRSITCNSYKTKRHGFNASATIGYFKEATSGILEVELANPVEI